VKEIVDAIQAAGIRDVSFLAEPIMPQ